VLVGVAMGMASTAAPVRARHSCRDGLLARLVPAAC